MTLVRLLILPNHNIWHSDRLLHFSLLRTTTGGVFLSPELFFTVSRNKCFFSFCSSYNGRFCICTVPFLCTNYHFLTYSWIVPRNCVQSWYKTPYFVFVLWVRHTFSNPLLLVTTPSPYKSPNRGPDHVPHDGPVQMVWCTVRIRIRNGGTVTV